jgi:hypothetical protein
MRAESLGIAQIDRGSESLHVRFSARTVLPSEGFVRAVRSLRGASVSAQGLLRVPLRAASPLEDVRQVLDALEHQRAAVESGSPV